MKNDTEGCILQWSCSSLSKGSVLALLFLEALTWPDWTKVIARTDGHGLPI